MARGGQQQDDVVHAAVALLEGEPPFQGLEVVRPHLGLHAEPPARAGDEGIPGAPIAGDGERDLGCPAERRVEPGAEPGEERGMPGVANRIPARHGAHHEVQADGGQHRGRVGDAELGHEAPLHAAHHRARAVRRGTDVPLAQGMLPPSEPKLAPDRRQGLAGAGRGVVVSRLACRHEGIVAGGAYPCLTGRERCPRPPLLRRPSTGPRRRPAVAPTTGASDRPRPRPRWCARAACACGDTFAPPGPARHRPPAGSVHPRVQLSRPWRRDRVHVCEPS